MNTKTANSYKSMHTAKRIRLILLYIVMTLLAVVMIFPFYYSLVTSLRAEADIINRPVAFIPERFTLENYANFFTNLTQLNSNLTIYRLLGNTFFTVICIIAGSLFTCALAAYSLARLNYKGKGVILKVFYISMMIPGVTTLVSQYSIVRALGLVRSLGGIIVPALFSIYGTLFLRSFFLGTPKEIGEAARIDGAGEFSIFLKLYLRMIIPGLITLGLMTFNGNWNSYLWPKIVLTGAPEKYVLAVAMREFQMINSSNNGPKMAAAIITILPTIMIFICGQKFFLDNLSFTGIK